MFGHTLLAVTMSVLFAAGGEPGPRGSVAGRVTNPDKCTGVQVLQRKGAGVKYPALPKVFPAKFDAKTGQFRAEGLPDGEYALRVLIPGGWVDGADMRLEKPTEEGDAFGKEDEEAIRKLISDYPDAFTDIFRPIYIRGNSQYASVLVEKIRARQFHSGKAGEIVWRVEVWRYEKHTGAWVKRQRSTTTLCRIRVFGAASSHYRRGSRLHMTTPEFEKLVWLFSPETGGIEVAGGESAAGLRVTAPEIDMKHGKTSGSVMKQIEEFRKSGKKHLE